MIRICYDESDVLIHEGFTERDLFRGFSANPLIALGNLEKQC